MSDLRTLGKAMRDAQREAEDYPWDVHRHDLVVAAEAAFDKALSEPPAALADIEGLVKRLRERPYRMLNFRRDTEAAATALEALNARVVQWDRSHLAMMVLKNKEADRAEAAEARAAQLEAALRECISVLEGFGGASDVLVSPDVWRLHDARGAIDRAKAALSETAEAGCANVSKLNCPTFHHRSRE